MLPDGQLASFHAGGQNVTVQALKLAPTTSHSRSALLLIPTIGFYDRHAIGRYVTSKNN